MKRLSIFIICAFALLSCNGGGEKENTGSHAHDEGVHSQTYACPMHPEVTSDKPGKCSKCGMELVLREEGETTDKYMMDYKSEPGKIIAGEKARLIFRPIMENMNDKLIPLDEVHEKKMHLLIVSRDLSYFAHEHPDLTSESGYVWEHVFPFGGDFILFQDYTPQGSTHQLGRQNITVEGPKRESVTWDKPNKRWEADRYSIELNTGSEPIRKGQPVTLTASVKLNGEPVNDIQNYLGALGHMVVISADTDEYLHVHPLESSDKGPEVKFHSEFPKEGFYRVFLQVKHNGKLQTADFTIEVLP
ncbi:MAG: hypothetical protein M3Q97_00240 [Bacteroidota bacterium]|nr:hypothetical protein [Bacteroidota bacterium]